MAYEYEYKTRHEKGEGVATYISGRHKAKSHALSNFIKRKWGRKTKEAIQKGEETN